MVTRNYLDFTVGFYLCHSQCVFSVLRAKQRSNLESTGSLKNLILNFSFQSFNLFFFFLTKLCSSVQSSLVLYDRKIGHFWHFVVPDLYAKDRPDNTILCLTWAEHVLRLETFFSSSCKPCKKITMILLSHYFWRMTFLLSGNHGGKRVRMREGFASIMCFLRFLYLRRRRSNSIPWCIFPEASRNIAVIADFIVK